MASKKIAFIGDLHFYDGVTKSHVNYYENCMDCMNRYTQALEEAKPDYIILTGDIVGLTERVLRTRIGLSVLIAILQKWNAICTGNLYAVSGNHDYTKGTALSDFDLLTQLGIIKTADKLDVNTLRVHMIPYGAETRDIEVDETRHNIAVMHANLQVDGATTWFYADEGIALSSLHNLKGVELVIAGHIHNPSPRAVTTSIEDKSVSLVYLGCATRPKRRDTWTNVYMGIADCLDNGDVNFDLKVIGLKPCEEIFTERAQADNLPEEDVIAESPVVNIELLTKILDELSPALMGSHLDYRTQVYRLAGVDKAAAEMAISYLDMADERAKVV